MSRSPMRDLVAGIFVLVGITAVAILAFRVGANPLLDRGGLRIYAVFDQTGGLKPRAPVEIAGVKVGQVADIALSPDFRARVALDLRDGLQLPIDTSASIVTAGVLGDRYVSLQLGGDDRMLGPEEEITFTESAVILERLIGKLVHNAGVNGGGQ
ncbi:outer membrane lipid asymmetry maintenance protein MlaD [Candidatus Binatia bacterium]|nr:outer membrane lipid asymmetry maintenance protein MlaD [Candidatus Binatia bacterium]